MKKTYIKKTLDEFYKFMSENLDMKQYEVAEISMRTCISQKGELFVNVVASVASSDPKKKDYKIRKDFDL